MSLEMVVLALGVGALTLFAWREANVRRSSKAQKTLKALQKRVGELELVLEGLPGAETLAELEKKVAEASKAAAASPPEAFKRLVERVNQVSADAMELKTIAQSTTARVQRLEQGAKWTGVFKKEE